MKTYSPEVQGMFHLAYLVATESVDPSTQNGAVIVAGGEILAAINHSVGMTADHEDFAENKYAVMEHAERAVILEAARQGIRLEGSTMYTPWSACADCARAIALSGIKTLYRHQDAMDRTPERWLESVRMGDRIMREHGVEIVDVSGKVGAPAIRHIGEIWEP